MTATTAHARYVVVSPQEAQNRAEVGSYAEQFGWCVKDTQADLATTGQVFWSGSEREMRRTARELNQRAAVQLREDHPHAR